MTCLDAAAPAAATSLVTAPPATAESRQASRARQPAGGGGPASGDDFRALLRSRRSGHTGHSATIDGSPSAADSTARRASRQAAGRSADDAEASAADAATPQPWMPMAPAMLEPRSACGISADAAGTWGTAMQAGTDEAANAPLIPLNSAHQPAHDGKRATPAAVASATAADAPLHNAPVDPLALHRNAATGPSQGEAPVHPFPPAADPVAHAHALTPRDADARLAATQAQVDAFAQSLQLARQTAHHETIDPRHPHEARSNALAPSRAQARLAAAPSRLMHSGAAGQSAAHGATHPSSPVAGSRLEALADLAGAPAADNPLQPALTSIQSEALRQDGLGQPATTDPAAQLRAATLTQEVGSSAWSQALSQHVLKMVASSQQNTQLQLNPSALGPLKVTLSLNEQQLQAQFETVHDEVRQAIESALPQLRSALAAQGVALGGAWVTEQPSSPNLAAPSSLDFNAYHAGGHTGEHTAKGDSSHSNMPGQQASAAPRLQDGEPGEPRRTPNERTARGLLDTYA